MAEFLGSWKRTQYCAQPGESEVGKELTLMGWAGTWRNLGALIFIGLRDRTGVMQVVFDASTLPADVFEKAESIRSEYVIAVKGTLARRTPEMVNPNMPTGAFELLAKELKILSVSQTPPFYIQDDVDTQEQLRLKYRYPDLRRPVMQQRLRLRHEVAKITRDYFAEQGFLEVETPMLQKSTPEGARDYLVPSRVKPGTFYALPQSPQIFKQLLMLSGCDRYMQIARCFRDEDLRADRQPEFTQIDLEMSFVDVDDVIAVNEGFLKRLFKEVLNVDVQLPIQRMKWIDAMNRYGSDKPDTRFGMELVDVSDVVKDCEFGVFTSAVQNGGSVRCINVKGGVEHFPRKKIDELSEFVKTYKAKGLAWMSMKPEGMQCSFAKFLTEEQIKTIQEKAGAETNDLIFFVADQNEVVWAALGALRLEIAKRLDMLDPNQFNFLWVVEFPQFEWSEEENRFMAMHHPFTSPMEEDVQYLFTDPARVRAKAYDIVLNGNEIGGGSIRIHSAELQEKMFEALGFTQEQAWARFGFLMGAFKFGPPPHGGLAYGLDRLVMLMCNAASIRDVIAFPKVQTASCLMSGAPDTVDEKQLHELHIALALEEEKE
ncbi:MAG: aspartate--tRNA ligase [Eubacteriales bacterium]|nr:aspartate--tRNA ligase [Eubacteriales bacterium]